MLLLQVGTLSPSRNQVSINNNKYVHMCALSTHNDCTSPICFSKASYEITSCYFAHCVYGRPAAYLGCLHQLFAIAKVPAMVGRCLCLINANKYVEAM